MGFLAQGTVQMVQKSGVKLRVHPISDYKVRHKTKNQPAKEYTVFVDESDPRKAVIFPVEQDFSVDGSLKNLLAQAACNQVKVEIEIEISGGNQPRVVGLRVPAPPAST